MYKAIVEAIALNAIRTPLNPAIRDRFGEINYKDYLSEIKKKAKAFKDKGIESGENVIIIAAQDRKYLSSFHALQVLGAVPVPMERSTKPERIEEVAELTDARFCISPNDIAELITINCDELELGEELEIPAFSGDEIAEILFTTGTTGKSKGVVMTHKGDVAVAENVKFGVMMKPDNKEIIPMPLNHSFALRRYYSNMINGSSVVFCDGVINMKVLFDAVDLYGANSMAMNPAALGILLKMAKKKLGEIAPKIDYLQFGSSHLPSSDKETIKELMPNARLYDFYGSTEAGCACIINFNSPDAPEGCIGKPTKNSNFKIIDMEGNVLEIGKGEKGRLICSGGMAMKEYYKDPQTTAETLIDGFVYSNDLCEIDKEGRIYYYGRCDDVITCGGNKVAPQEVEDCAMGCSLISDCACIGVKDKILGAVPKLFVVPKEGYSEAELLKYLTERLEYYMVPKQVEIIDSIPKTFNGKPLRRQLAEKEK